MKKFTLAQRGCSLVLGLGLILVAHTPVSADTMTSSWSGAPIVGGAPSFFPSGTAVFVVSGTILTITVTNDTTQQMVAISQVLSGLTWDIIPSVTLTPVDAKIASGSLVGAGCPALCAPTDLSGEWAYKDTVAAGSSPVGPLGSFGISAVGDVNFGADTFGVMDRFGTANLFGPTSINGIDASIVGPNVNFNADGFKTQGPVVQGSGGTAGQMVFTFNISGSLSANQITNVQPLFGTEGVPLVPEPSTLVLLGSGFIGLASVAWRRHRRK